jgi:hypothetical protein
MLIHTQQMDTEGTTIAASSSEAQREGMQPGRKKGLLTGRTAISMLILFGLLLAVAIPFGLGVVVLIWVIALIGAVMGAGFAFFTLLKELLGKTPAFGYAPTTAYMTGKKMKKRAKEGAGSADEQKKDVQ